MRPLCLKVVRSFNAFRLVNRDKDPETSTAGIRVVIAALALAALAGWFVLPPAFHSSGASRNPDAESAADVLSANPAGKNESKTVRVSDEYGKLPLSFEANRGQADERAKFVSRGSGYSLFLTSNEMLISLRKTGSGKAGNHPEPARNPKSTFVRMKMIGARNPVRIEGQDELPGKSNYFIGNDPQKWRTNLPNFQRVHYSEIYPGIDLNYYGNQQQLEYDFVVAPHRSARTIKMYFAGARRVRIDRNGDLLIQAGHGEIRQLKPVVYQERNGARQSVAGRYVLLGKRGQKRNRSVGFSLGKYDHSLPLVIDPTLIYSSYLGGGGGEEGRAIAVDALGNAYVGGTTGSIDFPTTNGAYQSGPAQGDPNAFVTKIDPTGSVKLYSTYFGGACGDNIFGIAVNSAGEAHVTGDSASGINPQDGQPGCEISEESFTAFPQVNSFGSFGGALDGFMTKLTANGDGLLYSSFLGGGQRDRGVGIALDSSGNAYVTGETSSTDFPNSSVNGSLPASYQPTLAGGGSDAFVTKVGPSGALLYSTYFGGGGFDFGWSIAVDAQSLVYITGMSGSGALVDNCGVDKALPELPTTAGAFQRHIAPSQSSPCAGCCEGDVQYLVPNFADAFVAKMKLNQGAIDPGDPVLLYGTYLGGGTPADPFADATEEGRAIALDSAGNVYVTGLTSAANFPTKNPYQSTFQGGSPYPYDAFVTKLRMNGDGADDLVYSTYLGGAETDEAHGIVVNSSGEAFVGGAGNPPPVNALPNGGSGITFLTKFNASGQSVLYSTAMPGASVIHGLALGSGVNNAGNVYLTGVTQSGLVTTPGVFQPGSGGNDDAFVAQIGETLTTGCVPLQECRASRGACDPAEICNADGTCPVDTQLPNDTSCDDGNACTTDTCQAGVCTGSQIDCSAYDSQCSVGVCDPATGTCSAGPAREGLACNDGNACTRTDICQAGTCVGADEVVCTGDQCHDAGTCDPQTGVCSSPAKADGTTCNDGNACTRTDTCQAGSCTGSDEITCIGDQCNDSGTCDPQTGWCATRPKADGTSCNDGNACTQTDTCQAGSCTGADEITCIGDQCNDSGTCDPQTGWCATRPKADGTTCNDGNACTQTDTCQAGSCTGANEITCIGDQCNDSGTCDPQTGWCATRPKADGTSCNDGNACTQTDTCQSGSCAGSDPKVCTASDQCHDAGTCDPQTGYCSSPAKADGTSCNDGDACTQIDTCRSGSCTGSNTKTCTASDQCHDAGICDPMTGTCSNPASANGKACNDANGCTTTDTCTTGVCGGIPVVCAASDQCHTSGTCDPSTGSCSNPPKPNGTACDDGNRCTPGDSCQIGTCTAGPAIVCTASDQCHNAGTCNPVTGACSDPAKTNGTACSDGNVCTSGDSCQSGSCSGTAVCSSPTQTGFVIGDRNATVGSRVTFWGSQWSKNNSLSGGSAPSSFKGFAYSNALNPPACGNAWRTDSSDPPAAVPEYIVILVSSSVTKSGSVFSGNTRQMVVVRTDSGYSASPGHAGTGTVVAVSCQVTTAGLTEPSLKNEFWLGLSSLVPRAVGSWLGL